MKANNMCTVKSILAGILVLVSAVAVTCAPTALAGSIIINVNPGQPSKPLSYSDEAGRVVELGVSWSDVQIATRAKRYIRATYGADLPFSIDRNTVHIQTDAGSNEWTSVPVGSLGR